MKLVLLFLSCLALCLASPPIFGDTWEVCIDEVQFSNSPGPRITLLGYSGPGELYREFVVVTSNKKHGAQTYDGEVTIDRLGATFSCNSGSSGSTSFNDVNSETDPYEALNDLGEPWQYNQEWCKKQRENLLDEWTPPQGWNYDSDPASWLCCFAKNWKGPNLNHNDPTVNAHDALKNTGPGGNPFIWIAAKPGSGVDVNSPDAECREVELPDGSSPKFCKIGKGKGSDAQRSCISFSGNIHKGCGTQKEFCDNSVTTPGTNGNVYVTIGGDGSTFTCVDIDVVLLLSNNDKFTHSVTEDDVVLHENVGMTGQAYFLKSGHPVNSAGDLSNRCETFEADTTITNSGCDGSPSCGGARCSFGGDPQIYMKSCDGGEASVEYFADCNHVQKNNAPEFDCDRYDPCLCSCEVEPEQRRSVANTTRRGSAFMPCPDTTVVRNFGVREALELHDRSVAEQAAVAAAEEVAAIPEKEEALQSNEEAAQDVTPPQTIAEKEETSQSNEEALPSLSLPSLGGVSFDKPTIF